MLNPTCPRTKKEQLYVVLHHECPYYMEQGWANPKRCENCSYAKFPNVIVPTINRAFPKLIANDIFGAQPMEGPIETIYKKKRKTKC